MKLYQFVFSPTGGTRKVADRLAAGLSEQAEVVDLCNPRTDFGGIVLPEDAVAVIAVPSYGGRVPAVAVERLSAVHGNGARAVLTVVYGNRAFEDTMVELEDTARGAGFRIVAGVAAVAEHSIARRFAAGRPDAADCAELETFGRKIAARIVAGSTQEPEIPGNRPYKKTGGSGMVPKATQDCVGCGICAEQCPVQAIDRSDPRQVDAQTCISCMRCVSVCPHGARQVSAEMLAAVDAMLSKVCSDRKQNELFL